MLSYSPSNVGHRRLRVSLLACTLCFASAGCAPKSPAASSGGSDSSGSGGSGNAGPFVNITGNWEFSATPTKGAAPFTVLSGFINELGTSPTQSDYVTLSFQVQSSTCYSNSPKISMQGGMLDDGMNLLSFPVDGQTLTAQLTKNAEGSQITGNYAIEGGCGNGEQGTLAGILYAPLTGTYSGQILRNGSMNAIQLTLSQDAQGTGDGLFFVTGTAALNGFACFTNGTLTSPSSWVTGSSATLTMITDEASGSQVNLQGNFDPKADTFTITTGNVTGGNCAGPIGAGVLTLRP